MIRVLFFASLREQLGCPGLELAPVAPNCDVRALLARLVAEHGEAWAEAFAQENLIVAVNQHVVDRDAPVADGDEVAFFPPVTGG